MATTAIDLSSLNGTNGFRLDGVLEFDLSGISVSNAGYVNGDGYYGFCPINCENVYFK